MPASCCLYVMRGLVMLFVCFITVSGAGQVASKDALLKGSKDYYQSLQRYSATVISRYTNPFIVDTPKNTIGCYVDRPSNRFFFRLNSQYGYLVDGDKEVRVNLIDKTILSIPASMKKGNYYESQLRYFPVIDANLFFDEFVTGLQDFQSNDTAYVLAGRMWTVEFRKEDLSVKRAVKREYDEDLKDYTYNEWHFSPCTRPDDTLAASVALMNQWPQESKQEIKELKKEKLPRTFDRSLLAREDVTRMLEGVNLEGKTILFDVFFQGCYPCVLAYPYVEAIHQAKDSNLVVIGIDSPPADSVNLAAYRKKHNINYPVISGKAAAELTEELAIGAWPSFIVINPEGKITDYRRGFSKELLERLKKKYGTK